MTTHLPTSPLVVTVFVLCFVARMTQPPLQPQPASAELPTGQVEVKPPFRVVARQRVIYGDTDQMGVVYYANYLRWFELSRLEYFHARGGNYAALEAQGFGLPVVTAHAEYKASARYEDMVLITVHLAELKRVSMRFEYEIHRESDRVKLCTGYTVHACVGRNGRPAPMPKDLVALLKA
jgi:acyl-CoA thioester hydrolase